tara:strand:- start:13 stop:960 length:948 start_codon:yes stop_codon:yes gene_type:complete
MPGIFVAGHNGMVGSAVCRKLGSSVLVAGKDELDLRDQQAVATFLSANSPEAIIVAAAKVGGIYANNTYPAEFIYDNLIMEANLINGAWRSGCEKLLFLGSSCIYPKFAEQPICEESLLSDQLEPTNEPYAVAKIAGIKLCESYNRQYGTDFRSLMPTNLFGPGDNFHIADSHVIPALMRRIHDAKLKGEASVTVWGSGNAMREFLHVDDLAAACAHILELPREKLDAVTEPMCSHLNVGTGKDVTIRDLAEMLVGVIGFDGEIIFDSEKPDGAPRKLLDVKKINLLGWEASIGLEEGLASTYNWFLENQTKLRI